MRKKAPRIPTFVSTLVVGGEHSFVVEKLDAQLRRHGLKMTHHWEWKKKPKAFVGRVDVVFLVTDMVGHDLSDHVRDLAYAREVPIIYGTRKWATNKDRLERAGFPEIVAVPPLPSFLEEEPTEVVVAPDPNPIPDLTPDPTPDPTPEPPQQENNDMVAMPQQRPNSVRLRELYEAVILDAPNISNRDAFEKVKELAEGTDIRVGSERPDLLAAIRKDLGVVMPKNTRISLVKEPVIVATVPTSEVPPEVLAAAPPRGTSYRAASPDLRDLIRLMREAMAAENIESLTVTASSVKFRRVVIEEGSFDA